ncbi:MAG: dienelactone hydrolase family protein [Planctomycetes bacterium]|nr:dienelactone hydrolase family protein [Planctomycetota bacterium]
MHRAFPLAALLVLVAACASRPGGDASSVRAEPQMPQAPTPGQDPADTRRPAEKIAGGLTEAEFKALHAAPAGTVAALRGREVQIGAAKGYLSLPEGGVAPLPGVVVIHEWWGLNDNVKHWTDRIAAEGYAALAVDLYDGFVAKTADEAMAAIQKVDDAKSLAILRAGHAFLVTDPRVRAPRTASVGWCFGGRKSLELAIAEPDLDGAIVYYGNPITEMATLAPMRAELLGVFGTRDKSIPPEKVAAFREALAGAKRKFEIREYDADHAFANPSNPRYDEANAAKAWEVSRAFLQRVLRPQ